MARKSRAITGYHAIAEYIRRSSDAVLYLVAKESVGNPRVRELELLARQHDVEVKKVPASEDLAGLGGLGREGAKEARGAALLIHEASTPGVEQTTSAKALKELIESLGDGPCLVLMLDGVTDPQNLGAVMRSADQFAVELLILPTRRSVHETSTVARTSSGASAHVRVAEVSNLNGAIRVLQESGFWVYGADMAGKPAPSCDFRGRVAIVMGSEGMGLARLVRENCDALIAIPSRGHIDSLNISVAAGILMYEVRRQHWFSS
ncbi:MAG TPA: 23S rRNA (guanosine(2251)-2'-O)-methyltransferase RlmB [Spirochaetia bacterium]|nr:23S rRNA (guanosine(2251)-2'-O)-methyltransferase RlmB [Spirochaetia bacterium]